MRGTIFLCVPDTELRASLVALLRKRGFVALGIESSDAYRATRLRPDLIVIDEIQALHDPGASCAGLREELMALGVPVLHLSTGPEPDTVSVQERGLSERLSLPFSISSFMEIVERHTVEKRSRVSMEV